MKLTFGPVGCATVLLAVWPVGAIAQEAGGPQSDPPARSLAGPGAGVSRADLAAAYLRFERALHAHPFAVERAKEFNRAFDTSSMSFFGGNFGSAVAVLNETIGKLESGGADERPLGRRLCESVRVRIEPSVMVAGSRQAVRLSAGMLYRLRPEEMGARTEGKVALTVRAVPVNGVKGGLRVPTLPTLSLTFDLAARELVGTTEGEQTDWGNAPAGRYELIVEGPDGAVAKAAGWTVIAGPLAPLRNETVARLSKRRESGGALNAAIDACLSRSRLLTESPSPNKSAEFLLDPVAHGAEIRAEVEAIEQKRDPYRRRGGDWWLGVTIPGREIPCRVFAPAALAKEDAAPAPLVVVLHGAGGDESMFMEGYGAGEIKRLAEKMGFVVASPSTTIVQNNPAHFDAVVDAMKRWYNIDHERIYVIGHSMGGGAAGSLATLRGNVLAGVVCIAGAPFRNAEARTAPLLLIAGELDPLTGPGRMRGAVETARKEGRDIEMRVVKDYGHTLIVGEKLGEAVEWLLSRKLQPRAEGKDDAPMMMEPAVEPEPKKPPQ